jgi:hypothetical protein
MERGTGIEPATSSLGSWHSTAELPPLAFTLVREGLLVTKQAFFTHASYSNSPRADMQEGSQAQAS